MRTLQSLQTEVARLKERHQPRRRPYRMTTVENRAELERILADIEARTAAARAEGRELPTYPVAEDDPLKLELDRMIAELDRRMAQP